MGLRLAPELWLRGRARRRMAAAARAGAALAEEAAMAPPLALARALSWLPVVVAGALTGALHLGAPADVRAQYVVAAIPAGLTLLWRRSFYLPLVVGAATLALLRWGS